jgi:hypothetical protein
MSVWLAHPDTGTSFESFDARSNRIFGSHSFWFRASAEGEARSTRVRNGDDSTVSKLSIPYVYSYDCPDLEQAA